MNRIALLRFERGVTQEAVAEGSGISRATVIRLEAVDTPRPTATVAQGLAGFYGVSVAELLGLEEHAA